MKKKYTIQELANILGCSRVAIQKKIKTVDVVTGLKRYKNVYDIVTDNGIMQVLLTDEELEQEKSLSKGFNNVINNGYKQDETSDIIDIEPIKQENTQDKYIEFTERYINDYKTLIETHYQELRNRDAQILLLTTNEKTKENEYLQAKAEVKTLKERNRIITLWLIGIITLLVIVISSFITFINVNRNVNSNFDNVNKEVTEPETKIEQVNPTISKMETVQPKPTPIKNNK